MSNPIPRESRLVVHKRDAGCCQVCGMLGTDWHHRRSRRVKDAHQHCACVGVLLCRRDHDRAHQNPAWARERGLIVSIHEAEPGSIPMRTFAGWVRFDCTGGQHHLREEELTWQTSE